MPVTIGGVALSNHGGCRVGEQAVRGGMARIDVLVTASFEASPHRPRVRAGMRDLSMSAPP